MPLIFCTLTSFSFLNKFRNFAYQVAEVLHKSFSSSLTSSVTDFGYSFLLFSDKMSIYWLKYTTSLTFHGNNSGAYSLVALKFSTIRLDL
jgi:hypothetical protein